MTIVQIASQLNKIISNYSDSPDFLNLEIVSISPDGAKLRVETKGTLNAH